MDLTAAALVAMALSFVVFGTAAVWYVVPWMRTVALAAAISPLLWIHAFRYVALQLFSAQAFGFAIPNPTRDQIIYGDLIGMGLALATLYALRYRWRLAIPLAWVFVVGNRDRSQQRRGHGHPRGPVRQGNRCVMADPDLLCPGAVGQCGPGGVAAVDEKRSPAVRRSDEAPTSASQLRARRSWPARHP
jgi:hypothetical protein